MAYSLFDPTKPDATAQTLTQMGMSERMNMAALRDACTMGGGFPGFNLSLAGGVAGQPASITYTKGTERVQANLTWGTTGGEAGNVTVSTYYYSANSGTNWDVIGTNTISYDANSNVVATTWS